MMASDQSHITVTVSPEAIARLRELAREWGHVTQSGRMAGQGNVSGLLEAVGVGDLVIWRRQPTAAEMLARQEQLLAQFEASPDITDGHRDWQRRAVDYWRDRAAFEQKPGRDDGTVELERWRLAARYSELMAERQRERVAYEEARATRQLALPEAGQADE